MHYLENKVLDSVDAQCNHEVYKNRDYENYEHHKQNFHIIIKFKTENHQKQIAQI